MPRYFFDIETDAVSEDAEGTLLADAEVAHVEAVALAGAIIHDRASGFSGARPWRFIVRDESGKSLFSLRFEKTAA